MGRYETDDIIGYDNDGDIWCVECWNKADIEHPENKKEITEDMIITEDNKRDESIFCDQCKDEL